MHPVKFFRACLAELPGSLSAPTKWSAFFGVSEGVGPDDPKSNNLSAADGGESRPGHSSEETDLAEKKLDSNAAPNTDTQYDVESGEQDTDSGRPSPADDSVFAGFRRRESHAVVVKAIAEGITEAAASIGAEAALVTEHVAVDDTDEILEQNDPKGELEATVAGETGGDDVGPDEAVAESEKNIADGPAVEG